MINNKNYKKESAERLPLEINRVFTAREGYGFSHHAALCIFKGKHIAMWSLGEANEDDVGQRVVISESVDFITWSEPRDILGKGALEKGILTACGFYENDGELVAFIGYFEYDNDFLVGGHRQKADASHRNTKLFAVKSKDGYSFSSPLDTGLSVVLNLPPRKLLSGNIVALGNVTLPVTEQADACGGYHMRDIFNTYDNALIDDSAAFSALCKSNGLSDALCEANIIDYGNNKYKAMLRNKRAGGNMYASDSNDLLSWSKPYETEFTDNNSKSNFGRIGELFYYIGNPDNDEKGRRSPLVLSLSRDGENFDRHFILREGKVERRFDGFYKNGNFAYPYSFADKKYLYFIYTTQKENVEVGRVKLNLLK